MVDFLSVQENVALIKNKAFYSRQAVKTMVSDLFPVYFPLCQLALLFATQQSLIYGK